MAGPLHRESNVSSPRLSRQWSAVLGCLLCLVPLPMDAIEGAGSGETAFTAALASQATVPGEGMVGNEIPITQPAVVASPTIPVLRVAADPDNLPFSNQRLEGFENRIVALLADEIGATVEYVWTPTHRGTFRQGLREAGCQIVAAVAKGAQRTLTTAPYYRSGYVLVYRSDRTLPLSSLDDPALRSLRIGVQMEEGPEGGVSVEEALAQRGLTANIERYRAGDGTRSPLLDALARGEIDTAILWGPRAGYLAQQYPGNVTLVPIGGGDGSEGILEGYEVCLGVERDEHALRDAIDQALARRQVEIEAILRQFGVPLAWTNTGSY